LCKFIPNQSALNLNSISNDSEEEEEDEERERERKRERVQHESMYEQQGLKGMKRF